MFHDHAQIDLMFQALADPARRLMVERLSRGPASVSELARAASTCRCRPSSSTSASAAGERARSHRKRSGGCAPAASNPRRSRTVEQWITERRTVWERRFDRLGEFLARHPTTKTEEEKIMTERSVDHSTIVIERSYDASPARVFAAWSTGGAAALGLAGRRLGFRHRPLRLQRRRRREELVRAEGRRHLHQRGAVFRHRARTSASSRQVA